MINVKLECKNVSPEKIVNLLAKFGKSFPFEYDVKINSDKIVADFCVNSISALNELTRRLKHVKNINFTYRSVQKVLPSEK